MRMLYIANARMPTEKAHGLQIAKIAEAFAHEGADVTLLLPKRKNTLASDWRDFYDIRSPIAIQYIANHFGWLESIWHNGYFTIERVLFGVLSFFSACRKPYDMIFTRELLLAYFLTLVGKPVVYEDHEPKMRFRWLYKHFVRTIKKKVVVAHHLTKLYEAFGIERCTYVEAPNGVDLSEFEKAERDRGIWKREFGIEPQEQIVLYVGHFYAWKGVYTLLDATRQIRGRVILIGGTREDEDRVRSYIRAHGLANISIKGFVPHREIIQFIKSADVLVLPNTAKEERSQKYTTPIKLFEYMASGVPIVASNLESFTPYLQDKYNGILSRDNIP